MCSPSLQRQMDAPRSLIGFSRSHLRGGSIPSSGAGVATLKAEGTRWSSLRVGRETNWAHLVSESIPSYRSYLQSWVPVEYIYGTWTGENGPRIFPKYPSTVGRRPTGQSFLTLRQKLIWPDVLVVRLIVSVQHSMDTNRFATSRAIWVDSPTRKAEESHLASSTIAAPAPLACSSATRPAPPATLGEDLIMKMDHGGESIRIRH